MGMFPFFGFGLTPGGGAFVSALSCPVWVSFCIVAFMAVVALGSGIGLRKKRDYLLATACYKHPSQIILSTGTYFFFFLSVIPVRGSATAGSSWDVCGFLTFRSPAEPADSL